MPGPSIWILEPSDKMSYLICSSFSSYVCKASVTVRSCPDTEFEKMMAYSPGMVESKRRIPWAEPLRL